MTIIFNSNKLPHRNTKTPFGFVQARYEPLSVSDYDDPIPKCSNCKTKQFPLKTGGFSCPICSPDSDFIEGSLRIRKGSKKKLLYFFAFDVQFSIDKTRCLLNQLCDAMNDDDTAVIICLSTPYTIVSVKNSVSFYTVIDDVYNFVANDEYELTKKQIQNYVLPSLISLYSVQAMSSAQKSPIDVIPVVQILIHQSKKNPFAAFCFINSPISPITAEKAAASSRIIASNNGIIHFGVNESFKKLTAIARMSMGLVFGISQILPSTIQRLINLSQPAKMKVIMPRFIEVTKVTSSDGSMNMTAYTTKIILTSLKGCSARMNVDFTRVDDNHISSAKFIEITENSYGRFISLHSFGWSESAEMFDSIALSKPLVSSVSNLPPADSSIPPTLTPNPVQLNDSQNSTANSGNDNNENNSQPKVYDLDDFGDKNWQTTDESNINLLVTKNLILKGCASDVLRATWAGGNFARHVENLVNDPQLKDYVMSSCLVDALKKQERGVERFYYVLYTLLNDMSDKVVRVKKDHVLITPPIVFIYSTLDNPTDIIEKYFLSEWPLEVRILTDFDAFLLAAENQGFSNIRKPV